MFFRITELGTYLEKNCRQIEMETKTGEKNAKRILHFNRRLQPFFNELRFSTDTIF
jgi:hypothetical protein